MDEANTGSTLFELGLFALGKKGEFSKADGLERVEKTWLWMNVAIEQPTYFPRIPEGRVFVIEIDYLVYQMLYICTTLDGLQWLWSYSSTHYPINIAYYSLEGRKEDFVSEEAPI